MISPAEMAKYRANKAIWEDKTKPIRDQIAGLLEPKKQKILKEFVDKYPEEIQAVIAKPAAERTPFEWQMYAKAKPYLTIDNDTAAKALSKEDKKKYEGLLAELKQFSSLDPGEAPVGIGMRDIEHQGPFHSPVKRRCLGCSGGRSSAGIFIDY